MVSAVARPVRILVGGLDFSENFISYSGARSTADTSGLLSISGQIELQYIPGNTPESLDDRLNSERWYRGQKITLDIGNEAGGWDRFPHGALRLIEAEFDGRGRLKLEVGDLIAYGSFKEATDYRDAGIDPPNFSTAGTIVNRLLAKMGMPALNGDLGGLKINYPIDLGDNYWDTIGRLAFSAGRYIYIDRFEVIRAVAMRSQPGEADLTLTIGEDEIEYNRLTGARKPPEQVMVVGTRKIVTAYTAYTVSVSEEFGPAYLLGIENSNVTKLLSQTKIIDDWQPDDDRRRITTLRKEARKLINPDETAGVDRLQTSLDQVEDYIYEPEGNGDDDSGKLLRVEGSSRAPRIIAIAPYEEGWSDSPYVLSDYQKQQTVYSYTDDEQTTDTIRETQWDTAANIVLDEDWESSPNSPYTLHINQDVLRGWAETIPELEWETTTLTRKAAFTASEEGKNIPDNLDFRAKLALLTTGSDRETSNSGLRPPAPDRRPAKYSVIEKAFRHLVRLPQKGGSYRERVTTLQIPFLPGEVGSSVGLKRRRRVYSFGSMAWPKYLGQLFGALLIGRHKGSEISLPYRDALTALTPLSVVDIIEPLFEGGTATRSYLVDGDAYALVKGENRCGFDLVWLGDRSGLTATTTVTNPDGSTTTQTVQLVDPPYAVPSAFLSYGAGVSRWATRPYGSIGAVNSLESYGTAVSIWSSEAQEAEVDSEVAINGQILCTTGAPKASSGKALEVYGPAGLSNFDLVIEIGYDMVGRDLGRPRRH